MKETSNVCTIGNKRKTSTGVVLGDDSQRGLRARWISFSSWSCLLRPCRVALDCCASRISCVPPRRSNLEAARTHPSKERSSYASCSRLLSFASRSVPMPSHPSGTRYMRSVPSRNCLDREKENASESSEKFRRCWASGSSAGCEQEVLMRDCSNAGTVTTDTPRRWCVDETKTPLSVATTF